MKKGDIVTIEDYSYVVEVKDGVLRLVGHHVLPDNARYIVVEVNCQFPQIRTQRGTRWYNNTIIQEVNGNRVFFIENDQLEPTEIIIREVTMAEVCAQFGEDVKIRKD